MTIRARQSRDWRAQWCELGRFQVMPARAFAFAMIAAIVSRYFVKVSSTTCSVGIAFGFRPSVSWLNLLNPHSWTPLLPRPGAGALGLGTRASRLPSSCGSLVAGAFGFGPRDYFELSDAAERDVPQVALPGRSR